MAAQTVRHLIIALTLAFVAATPAPAATCDVCRVQLTSHTGPYVIRLAKEATSSAADAPRMRVIARQ